MEGKCWSCQTVLLALSNVSLKFGWLSRGSIYVNLSLSLPTSAITAVIAYFVFFFVSSW